MIRIDRHTLPYAAVFNLLNIPTVISPQQYVRSVFAFIFHHATLLNLQGYTITYATPKPTKTATCNTITNISIRKAYLIKSIAIYTYEQDRYSNTQTNYLRSESRPEATTPKPYSDTYKENVFIVGEFECIYTYNIVSTYVQDVRIHVGRKDVQKWVSYLH